MITEQVATLFGNSLDRSSNVTVQSNITTKNICKYTVCNTYFSFHSNEGIQQSNGI